MAMLHKAFMFDFAGFEAELKATLVGSLLSGETEPLKTFIEENMRFLEHPDGEGPLQDEWREQIPAEDVHAYGDVALTKYYDPEGDIGLDEDWQELQDILAEYISDESPILGLPLGPPGNVFDPGRMGSYFQSESDVVRNLAFLGSLDEKIFRETSSEAIEMLTIASRGGKGLYVTF